MTFEINEQVSAEQLSSLRESVGWNRMEKELSKEKEEAIIEALKVLQMI